MSSRNPRRGFGGRHDDIRLNYSFSRGISKNRKRKSVASKPSADEVCRVAGNKHQVETDDSAKVATVQSLSKKVNDGSRMNDVNDENRRCTSG